MPGAMLPDDPATPAPADWYSPEELDVFRLSSKSHWDLPIRIGRETVHFLVSHPTPPVFDGPEDRNGTRNFDEIRFWADYVRGGRRAAYIYDDEGRYGGLRSRRAVRDRRATRTPTRSTATRCPARSSSCSTTRGSTPAPTDQRGRGRGLRSCRARQRDPRSPSKYDTADFAEPPGQPARRLRAARASDMRIEDSAVFWPVQADPLFRLTGVFPFPSSDHRLVWVDVKTGRR